ncbi:hybrid sensor histidine kinase/response regulator transcription factor [Carboxylicivirga marina]|uniref:hybrid sensor histidine kinase/response regulator transcription factor n=1 Tax=Carboxylicivirga marina TaxID=2800988 RepID=UPI0025974422|nr:two-component regulator propeller domain-containing protein [uncultured Carboxylicivirga sp.]
MKDYTLKYFQLFLFLLVTWTPFAQDVTFENHTMANGLSHSKVNCIGQDKNGFIWIGTRNGLNIYDGTRFVHYFSKPSDENCLPGNRILSFLFEGDSVWIATNAGLCKMDIKTKRCRRYDLEENKYIITLCPDKNKELLWVGTTQGLVKLNVRSGQYRVFNTSNSNLSHNEINALYLDSEHSLWVGTFDKLNVLRRDSEVFETINLKTRQHSVMDYNLVLSIFPYSEFNDALLWVGTETGLALYNRDSGAMQLFHEENSNLSNSVIKTIFKTKAGITWLGTDFGLNRMDENLEITNYFHNLSKDNSLIDNVVGCVFEDNSGVLWLGTNNGVSTLFNTSQRFEFFPVNYSHKKNQVGYEISDIVETSYGSYWLASQNGVIKYGHNKKILEILNASQEGSRKLADDNTTRLFEDPKGNLWIASNGGLAIWNSNKEFLSRYSSDNESGLRSNFITSFHLLKDSTLLLNTEKGLHKVIEKEDGYKFEFLKEIGWATSLYENVLWSFNGPVLLRTDVNSFEQVAEVVVKVPGQKINIQSFLQSDDNTIWLGVDDGLIHYNPQNKQYNFYEVKSRSRYPLISLLEDGNGNIWASSYTAILKFSKDTQSFDIYPSGEELPIAHFKGHCAFKSGNGDLIFGGQDGFVRFSPEKITKSKFIAPVFITKLLVSNQEVLPEQTINGKQLLQKDIAFTSQLTLDHSSKSFSLEFSSLHFRKRSGIRYAYKLDNFDSEWIYTDGSYGVARYSNLKPGEYSFMVKGTNNEGVWNEKETVLNIKINPPLWASPLAIVIYIILVTALVIAYKIYARNLVRIKSQMQLAKLQEKHVKELSGIRQQYFTNMAHEFRTPLSLIIGPTEKLEKQKELSETSKNYVRIIENNARRLLWVNNQLLDFKKLENKTMEFAISEFDIIEFTKNTYELFVDKAENENIDYQFQSDFEKLMVCMDIRKVETILFNLLSNAFKFTPENGEINVCIKSEDINRNNQFEAGIAIMVADSGIGIAEDEQDKIFDRFYQVTDTIKQEQGSGIGLTMVKEYVTMHQGEIRIESEVGKGSEFKMLLPLFTEEECKQFFVRESELLRPLLKPQAKVRANEMGGIADSKAPFILLVEDDVEMSEFISLSLADKYRIQSVRNGKEALRMINDTVPDLVISDINMPEMDGVEFTRRFKGNPKTAHIPLILLTGESQNKLQLEGLKNGADAFMLKPFEIEILELRIDNFLKRQEQFSQFINVQHVAAPKEVQIASPDEKLLEEVVASIEKFISDPDLHVDKVCDDIGYSHSMLYRKVKKLTGQTLNEFIRTTRVRRAEQLLRTKKFNIAEVMLETGFTNHYYFSKSFKKVYKFSPKEYMNKL